MSFAGGNQRPRFRLGLSWSLWLVADATVDRSLRARALAPSSVLLGAAGPRPDQDALAAFLTQGAASGCTDACLTQGQCSWSAGESGHVPTKITELLARATTP